MTRAGSLLNYIQASWTETVPAAADVKFHEGWFDTKDVLFPQLVVTNLYELELERYRTGGSLDMRYNPRFAVNCVVFCKARVPGTAELTQIENMREEVRRIFVYGWGHTPQYGGSLSPLRVVLPSGPDRRLHQTDVYPPTLRYELELFCTEDIE